MRLTGKAALVTGIDSDVAAAALFFASDGRAN